MFTHQCWCERHIPVKLPDKAHELALGRPPTEILWHNVPFERFLVSNQKSIVPVDLDPIEDVGLVML